MAVDAQHFSNYVSQQHGRIKPCSMLASSIAFTPASRPLAPARLLLKVMLSFIPMSRQKTIPKYA